ncbi:MAG: DUF3108 domain-containing protein [Gammaproteobacteria bacterium]|nr:DUF3108 domain-containing protein [Gammaproteobacteria bacterium]
MYKTLAALLLLTVCSTGFSAELPIRPFNAEYTLYKSGLKVGEATLSLDKNDNGLRWRLTSEATGVYALFNSKKPLSVSIMERYGKDFRLARIQLFITRAEQPAESVHLNWSKQQANIKREHTSQFIALKNTVYDYLSIHWLAAQLTINKGAHSVFDFYRKGGLVQSKLELIGQVELDLNGRVQTMTKYRHSFPGASNSYEYYYGIDNPSLPLKIEKFKKGKTSSIMLFKGLN